MKWFPTFIMKLLDQSVQRRSKSNAPNDISHMTADMITWQSVALWWFYETLLDSRLDVYGVSVRMAAHWLSLGFMLLIFGGKTETRLSVASYDLQFPYKLFVSGWIYEMLLLTNCFSFFPKEITDHSLYVRVSNGSFVLFGMFLNFPLWNVFFYRRKSSTMRSSHLTETVLLISRKSILNKF